MALGDSWWSTMAVQPASKASSAPSLADHSMVSRSSARSSRHQISLRMLVNSVGTPGGAGMPRARAEYR